MHTPNIVTQGPALGDAEKVLILLHGRGAGAEDILGLAEHLDVNGFTVIAPVATNNSWYPFSFMAPTSRNEPWLSSALTLLADLVKDIISKKVPAENIYLGGFSQGACLMLEFAARHAARYGGIAAFTGGLIGDKIDTENYQGDFGGTPVFIGSSDPDHHIPVTRVYATANILRDMNAQVTEKIYPAMGHTIIPDEIDLVNKLIFRRVEDQPAM